MKGYKMEFHRYAFMFPEMTSEQFNDLKFSIRDNGLRDAIAVWHGQIADGRHRYKACQEVGIDPRYEDVSYMTETELLDYVMDKNSHRRHLTTGQLAMIGAEAKKEYEIQAHDNLIKSGKLYGDYPSQEVGSINLSNPPIEPIDSREKAARAMNVSPAYVSRAERIQESSEPLASSVRSGEISLNSAYEIAKDPVKLQVFEQAIKDPVQPLPPREAAKKARTHSAARGKSRVNLTPITPEESARRQAEFHREWREERKQQILQQAKELGISLRASFGNINLEDEITLRDAMELTIGITQLFYKVSDAYTNEPFAPDKTHWFVTKLNTLVEDMQNLIKEMESR